MANWFNIEGIKAGRGGVCSHNARGCLLTGSLKLDFLFAQVRVYRDNKPRQNGLNTLRPRQNERHFADDIFKWIFLNENVWIPIKISLKFVPQGPINNIPALVQIMAWRRPGDKPLSGPMMVRLPTHICVTRPQWVNHDYNMPFLISTHGC